MQIELLLEIVIALLVILILIVLKKNSRGIIDSRDIQSAISETWLKLELDKKLGAVESHAREIKESYKSFERMLQVPKERASFGELALETILADSLPHDMYGIRKSVFDGKKPDAHINSTVGIICIDSKFALDNYSSMVGTDDEDEKSRYKKQFLKDVKGHLDKIADDYVCPEKGSAEFAFAYIPSESVYYFLVNEAHDMLRDFTARGVQVVSPLTLSHKIELIKAGVHAKKLSEDAELVRNNLIGLSGRFKEIDELWRVFYKTHFRNLESKAEELDGAYQKLREEFDDISRG
jgi:DNA recombination protein RmuC